MNASSTVPHSQDHKKEGHCPICGGPIAKQRLRYHARFCSATCTREGDKRKSHELNEHRTWNVPSGTVGAIHELIVCTDLMKRGYHVFRAVSPACTCDVAVLHNRQLYRVEVTTGSKTGLGNVCHPPKDFSRFDILAVVSSGNIYYIPELSAVIGLDLEDKVSA